MKIAGLMTGTSCDGLDLACVEFRGESWRPLWGKSAPYPAELRARVLAAQLPAATLSLRAWGELHRDLGLWMAAALTRILARVPTSQLPDAIACHGQTVAHFPAAKKQGFTIQLGDPTRLAEATGLTVISDFRTGDMAAGGEGAPLAPRFHQLLAKTIAANPTGIAIHNLGGISNLTYFGPRNQVIAFDTGPANVWIDAAAELITAGAQSFDRHGKIASSSAPDLAAVDAILRDGFFRRPPPKSTGRDDFPFSKLLASTTVRDAALAATATEITVESIARAYRDFIGAGLRAVYFCGGGAHNRFLMRRLRERLNPVKVAALDDAGFDSKFLEAQAFAYFGFLALQGESLGGSWTGAQPGAPSAHLIPGRNWPRLLQRLAAAKSSTRAKPPARPPD